MKTLLRTLSFCASILFANVISAQSVKISGSVKDSAGGPLEMANIIALKTDDNSMASYAISNHKGLYELSVPANATYTLRFSYLGYETIDETIIVDGSKKRIIKNIEMRIDNNQLNAVDVVAEMPITISGDTIIYQADAFTNGEEDKLEDVLEKLPGFEVDEDGEITVQGKSVDKVMVEGRDFFDGDTKLATQNIPANAVDKVQVLRNYNEVSPMQGLDNDDRIALNIKLKDGKKNITFGDVKVQGGLDERYLVHPNIFYYTPKASYNIIGDVNNIGRPAFTYRDFFRFTGGFRDLAQRSGSNLQVGNDDLGFSIAQANRAKEMTSRMGAGNFSYNPSKKFTISGFAIGSQTITDQESATERTYIRDEDAGSEELLTTNSTQTNNSGLFKLSSTYTPSNSTHIGYDAFYRITDSEDDNIQVSDFGLNINGSDVVNNINALNTQQPVELKQSFESFYDYNEKSVFAFEAQHQYKRQDPLYQLNTTASPFSGAIPIIDTSAYSLLQNKLITTNKIDASLNYYYIINNKNHVNFTLGTSNSNQSLTSNISQLFNGSVLTEFDGDSLQNNALFNLTDIFLGVHFKSKIGKLTFSPGANLHNYRITDNQLGEDNFKEKVLLLPDVFARYEFRTTESLTFNYGMVAQFTDINNVLLGSTISGYNSLFVGNRDLDNSWYHNLSLNYYNFNMFNFTNIFAGLTYNRRVGDIINNVIYSGLDRINQPINTYTANDVLSGFGSYERRFGKLRARVRANVSVSNSNNQIDNQDNTNTTITQSYTISGETNFTTAPNVEIGYRRSTNIYTSSLADNTYYTDNPFAEVSARFLTNFYFEADYEYNNYRNKEGTTSSSYDFLNAKLTYQKQKGHWEFSAEGLNILNTTIIRQDAFSNSLISTSTYLVRPRYLLLGVTYHL